MLLSLRLLGALLLGSTACARANTVYNLTLTSSDGYAGGTGSFTLNTPPPATGVVTYVPTYAPLTGGPGTPGDYLLAFNAGISVAGHNVGITLSDLYPSFPNIQFTDGVPTDFFAFGIQGGQISSGLYSFGVGVSGYDYSSFRYTGIGFPTVTTDEGTVTITPAAVAATPEPSSLAFVGTGILGVAAVLRRRIRLPSSALRHTAA